ncbi:MAG: DUF1015 family protein [Myxococcota bacterium]
MADVRPFRALRPARTLAERVIAPPYDVLSDAQCRALAQDPVHFVHVTRAEVDLPEGRDPHSDEAYAKARDNLAALIEQGALIEDDEPHYYLYGQTMGDHTQIGVLGAASVAEYDDGKIAKHEFTRPDKEDDRTHHMQVIGAQVGLVFLAHRPDATLSALVNRLAAAAPTWAVTTDDGVAHRFWVVPSDQTAAVQRAFADIAMLYVADGHHRSAAASRVHAAMPDDRTATFVAGIYPSDELQVLAYNRVVADLAGLDEPAFLDRVRAIYDVTEASGSVPAARGEVTMRMGDRWYRLVTRPEHRSDDPVDGLDVAVLQDHVLGPVLGIDDPRRSDRITFVGGIHGPQALEAAVADGAAVAFHLFPTGLDQLFAVADAGRVMPPKSTWFEPKLREGVVSQRIR